MSRNPLSLLVLGVLASLACITSCSSPPPENTDNTTNPPAVTPVTLGYTLFQGKTEELLVSFEYPEDWRLSADDPDMRGRYVFLKFGSESPKWVHSFVLIQSLPMPFHHPPLAYENAHDLLQDLINDYLVVPPDLVIGTIILGGVQGETMSYSAKDRSILDYHSPNPEILHIIYRHVAVDYKGRIYWIQYDINTNVDDDEEYKPGFEHILATFKFLE